MSDDLVSDVIPINVGGRLFVTTKTTVMVPGSYFEARLSGRIAKGAEVDGAMFIDRDPALFEYVLQYLRNLDNWPVPADSRLLIELVNEARFYALDGMIGAIKATIKPRARGFWMIIINDDGNTTSLRTQGAPKDIVDIISGTNYVIPNIVDNQHNCSTFKRNVLAVELTYKYEFADRYTYDAVNLPKKIVICFTDRYHNDPYYSALRMILKIAPDK